jgi:replicative DNA helicase
MDYKKQNTYSLELGKLPPQAIELEEAVLGGIMLEKDALIEIIDIIRPESFYKDAHQKVYQAILDLFSNNKGIDILTIMDQCRINKTLEEIGGAAYLTGLTSRISSASHIEFHARIVQQKYIQRELIRAATEIQNKAFDESNEDVSELLDFSEGQIFGIAQGNVSQEAVSVGLIGREVLKILEETSKSDAEFSGLPSGLTALDRITSGFHTKFIIIAGRPAMGKTTLALQIVKNMALDFNIPAAFFSLEMTKIELTQKIISGETGIEQGKINDGKISSMDWPKFEAAQDRLEKAPLYIDDSPGLSPITLRAKCRRLKLKHDIKIVVIDYIQLMDCSGKGNREQEISTISRSLKLLSKELDIPVVGLSQLNRGVESRPDKRPLLGDLRESGSLEQDTDMVWFIYRPEYYGQEMYEDQTTTKNIVEVIIKKNRGGRIADVLLSRDSGFTKITDIETIEDVDNIEDLKPIDNSDLENNEAF